MDETDRAFFATVMKRLGSNDSGAGEGEQILSILKVRDDFYLI